VKISKLHILLIIMVGVTVSSAAAVEFHNNPPVIVNGGNLNILDGGMIFTRSDGIQTSLSVRNSDAQTAIIFEDVDSGSQYILRHTPDSSRFDFLDFNGTSARVDLAIERSSGNVGIGTITPMEELDVDGDIRLTGNLVSPNDICIGTCP
jgi:hypothetical protein